MYDMYPWDSASQGDYPPAPLRSRRNQATKSPEAPKRPGTPGEPSPARAVQVALDRRDNGGDAAATTAATTAGQPTASLARQ